MAELENTVKLSKYIYVTDSVDSKEKLLYNSKNGYFIKYSKQDFEQIGDFLNEEEIVKFLAEKEFLEQEGEIEYIRNRHIKEIRSEDTMMLTLKITRDCNFRCIYCYEDFVNKKLSEENQKIILKYIEKNLSRGKIKHLIIAWFGGEPLTNIKCIAYMAQQVMGLCEKYGVKYSSTVVTNGYLLSESYFEQLCKSGVTNFQVTIDGAPDYHNSQRVLMNGEPTFDVIYSNLQAIKKVEGNFHVILRTNISKKMINNMDEYLNKMKNFFEDERFVAMFHPVVDFENMEHEVTDSEVMKEIVHAMEYGFRFAALTEYLETGASFCYALKDNQFVIDTDLNVSKCTVVNEPFSIVGKIEQNGDLVFNSFANLWRSARISDKCVGCDYYAGCAGGACPMYYLKRGVARCMKYKSLEQKFEILKVADLQGACDVCIHR